MNNYQKKHLEEVDFTDEIDEEAKLIEADIIGLKDRYKKMMAWKQSHGNKMNFRNFKDYTDAKKRNDSLRR